MEQQILEAKRKLYSLLLKIEDDKRTDNELDIMVLLSKDKQIQDLFNEKQE